MACKKKDEEDEKDEKDENAKIGPGIEPPSNAVSVMTTQEGNATPIGQLVQILLFYYARNYRADGRTSCPIHHHLESVVLQLFR